MDIKRPAKSKLKKRIRTAALLILGLGAIGGITYGLTKLKPAAPTIERATSIIDTVKRGPMVIQVHGTGTLVPEVTRRIPAPADGRVEKIPAQAGVEVHPDTIIAELSNPQLEQQAMDADYQLKAAQADEENLRVRLESESITQQAAITTIEADYSQARMELDANEQLGKQGLIADLILRQARVRVQDLSNRINAEKKRLDISTKSTKAQLNAQRARVQQLGALAKLKHDQVENLKVRSGSEGVLQQITVEVGQQVTQGVDLARVADPASLKAVLKIAETQIENVRVGQPVEVDTHNGIIQGEVSRLDPAAREGTFTVDAALKGPLPPSARADLTVDGTIELARLANVLSMGRPAFGQSQSTVKVFRVSPDGQQASRTTVQLGRSSVSTIEIVDGLREGDQVIISDTSAFDNYDVIRLR